MAVEVSSAAHHLLAEALLGDEQNIGMNKGVLQM
jgi:hypothetical protein